MKLVRWHGLIADHLQVIYASENVFDQCRNSSMVELLISNEVVASSSLAFGSSKMQAYP